MAQRRGLVYGLAAYSLWGLFPLYWPLLKPAGAVEILAHRFVWSLVLTVLLVLAGRRVRRLRLLLADRRRVSLLAVGAVLITANWGTYIWAVNNDQVVETSLGYFVTPLVTVVLGVLVLDERLRRWQWVAVGIATAAVIGLTVEYGHPPWIALALTLTFSSYALIKKSADAGAVESLTFETMVITPAALGYLVWLGPDGQFLTSAGATLLLMGCGVVTVIPLLLFGASATRIPMTTLGLVQYITPTIQFVIGITLFDGEMSTTRWAGFALVWLALIAFTIEALRHRRTQLRLAAEATAL